jgi:hypothetical protein
LRHAGRKGAAKPLATPRVWTAKRLVFLDNGTDRASVCGARQKRAKGALPDLWFGSDGADLRLDGRELRVHPDAERRVAQGGRRRPARGPCTSPIPTFLSLPSTFPEGGSSRR